MASASQVLKSVGKKLVPFFKSVAIYFIVFTSTETPTVWSVITKDLPVISLIVFVLWHGTGLGKEHTYSRRILLGLVFSVLGDTLLLWKDYFLHGMGAFAIAHMFYISAFTFDNLKPKIAVVLFSIGALVLLNLLPHIEGPLAIAVAMYTSLLITMAWRALARIPTDRVSWPHLLCAIGALSFCISDGLIGHGLFAVKSIGPFEYFIMATYFLAQFGIAVSIVDTGAPIRD